jgi:hypothetical protein
MKTAESNSSSAKMSAPRFRAPGCGTQQQCALEAPDRNKRGHHSEVEMCDITALVVGHGAPLADDHRDATRIFFSRVQSP